MGPVGDYPITEYLMKNYLALVSILILAQSIAAGSDGKGGQPGVFRELALGGRASAMGGAFTAIAEGGAGFVYNPAGGAQSSKYAVSFSYRVMQLDRRLGYAAINIPAKEEAALSIHWTFSGTADLESRDEQGYVIDGNDISQSENFLGVSFSKVVIPQLILGLRAFYVQNNIGNINAYTAGADLGALAKIDIKKTFLGKIFPVFRAGFTAKNIGASYKWTTTDFWRSYGREQGTTVSEDFPVYYRMGVGLEKNQRYLFTADTELNSASMFKTHIGGEYNVNPDLALRSGLDDWHPTFGIGLNKQLSDFNIAVDISYMFEKVGEGNDFLVSFDVIF